MNFPDFPRYRKLIKDLPLGKRLPDAVYLHRSALACADDEIQSLVRNAATIFHIPATSWNILKFATRSFKITFLDYPRFDAYAYPELHQSHTVDLQRLCVRKASYAESENPPILHRKETFVSDDYPLYQLFVEITNEGENLGLYEKPRSIGFKRNWERLIHSKGCVLDESGRLHTKAPSAVRDNTAAQAAMQIERHKTAIDRNKLSSPMQTLARHGYLDGNWTVLDYGCGKGDDVRELEAHGVDVTGWDPVHRPEGKVVKRDIVNLGFVLNVIEDRDERRETLKKAFLYAKRFLIASVMVAGEATIRQFTPHKDGVITARNTFQRYYTQSEFKEYLEETLGEVAIAAGQGIFLIFKDRIQEQNFLFERQRIRRDWRQITARKARTETRQITRDLIDKNKALFSDFWETTLDLGRIPTTIEFAFSEGIKALAGSHKKAFEALKDYFGEESFQKARAARRDDLLVYFALGQFARRKAYSKMPDDMKRDIKTFFGTYSDAIASSTQLLFSVGNPTIIEAKAMEAYEEKPIGEFNPGHSWIIPKGILNDLPPELRVYVGCACQLYGDLDGMHLIKIHFASGKVSLMRYDDFGKDIPLLVQRVKIRLRDLDMDFFDYGGDYSPSPLENPGIYRMSESDGG